MVYHSVRQDSGGAGYGNHFTCGSSGTLLRFEAAPGTDCEGEGEEPQSEVYFTIFHSLQVPYPTAHEKCACFTRDAGHGVQRVGPSPP